MTKNRVILVIGDREGSEFYKCKVSIDLTLPTGHQKTLWHGDTDGLAGLVYALMDVRAENQKLRMMIRRARQALEQIEKGK